jgi:predicted DNA repair protein MutK
VLKKSTNISFRITILARRSYRNRRELYDVDIEATEKKKIKSAILTDFILSLEIIIISLSTVAEKSLTVRIMVLILIAIITTVGVYGIVALIVRLDDMGFALMRKGEKYKKKFFGKSRIVDGTIATVCH